MSSSFLFCLLQPFKQVSRTRSKMWMEKDVFQNNQNLKYFLFELSENRIKKDNIWKLFFTSDGFLFHFTSDGFLISKIQQQKRKVFISFNFHNTTVSKKELNTRRAWNLQWFFQNISAFPISYFNIPDRNTVLPKILNCQFFLRWFFQVGCESVCGIEFQYHNFSLLVIWLKCQTSCNYLSSVFFLHCGCCFLSSLEVVKPVVIFFLVSGEIKSCGFLCCQTGQNSLSHLW